jgi:hypothetical protein
MVLQQTATNNNNNNNNNNNRITNKIPPLYNNFAKRTRTAISPLSFACDQCFDSGARPNGECCAIRLYRVEYVVLLLYYYYVINCCNNNSCKTIILIFLI